MSVKAFTEDPGLSPIGPPSITADKIDSGVAVLTMDGPSPAVWGAKDAARFLRTVQQALARPSTRAVILTGRRLFADDSISPHGPHMAAVLEAFATRSTPVIAAIPGDATGQGLELALACSARVAASTSWLALPGIAAARLPSPNTLERLPRLIGVDLAVSMVALGEGLDGQAACRAGLIDAVADGDVVRTAARIALELDGSAAAVDVDSARIQAEFLGARIRLRRQAPGQTTVMFAVRALEAATLAPRRRVRAEIDRIALELGNSEQAGALRYAFEGGLHLQALVDRGALECGAAARALRWPMLREAIHLIDEGAAPAAVDRCLLAYGFGEGPFGESDRRGLETVFDIGGLGQEEPWIAYSPTLDLMIDSGRRGGPSAPGWLSATRTDGQGAAPDVEGLLRASAIGQRRHRGSVSDEVVVERCLFSAINASAKLLQINPALGASGVDAIWTGVIGFPAWKGGPLFQAQRIGLQKVVQTITDLDAQWATSGPACDLLIRAAASGRLEPRMALSARSDPVRSVAS